MSKLIFAAAALYVAQAAAQQPYRPQLHFSPHKNWTNDPNGLVYFDGEYHLFFQFNPFGDGWGHMSWGHAVSTDLLHWKELPVALPEENGIMIFTGSTVVDERNTSGFCTGGKPCLVAIYTGHTPKTATTKTLQTQNLAFSNDRGRTWTKYKSNPVIDLGLADFRDPHVFWSKSANRWVMVVALPDQHKVSFYGSADLKKWEHLSDFGPAGATSGDWECPTLAELPVEGEGKRTRFVLKIGLNPGALQGGSGEQYFTGVFDGKSFMNDNPPATTLWVDSGKDCYCALVFNHSPKPTILGWMSNWQYAGKTPTSPWRGQMTLPRDIALRSTPEGLRLVQQPVGGLTSLRTGSPVRWQGKDIRSLNAALRRVDAAMFDFQASIEPGEATDVGFRFLGGGDGTFTAVGYDRVKQELYVDRTHSGVTDFSKDFPARTAVKLATPATLKLRVVADASSIEVFAGDGAVAMTNLVYPKPGASAVEYFATGGAHKSVSVEVWPLRSAVQ